MGLKVGQPDVYEPIASHNAGSPYVLRNDYKKQAIPVEIYICWI
jgi:hypothetical protein